MIIGNGQIARAFKGLVPSDCVIFASGVSKSSTISEANFDRERKLLLSTILEHSKKRIVYFSSCALVNNSLLSSEYYKHKFAMEKLVKQNSERYYIFRLPQLFGKLHNHNTLINFFYTKILSGEAFEIYDEAYRYVIEINDMVLLVLKYLDLSEVNATIDLANPYRYKVMDIVLVLEDLMNMQANYIVKKKQDAYYLDLQSLENFVENNEINVSFSEDYIRQKLRAALKDAK